MKNKNAGIRYAIIDNLLRDKQNPYPNKQKIIEKCAEQDINVSERTVDKDIEDMRHDPNLNWFAPIKWSDYHKGYHYTEDGFTINSIALRSVEIDAMEFASGILSQFKGTELGEAFERAVEKILETLSIRRVLKNEQIENIFQIEKVFYFKGTEYLSPLIEMIKNSKVITFDYQSYERQTPKKHTLHPYLLKEYNNRWYVIGYQPEYKAIRTFGIDRLDNLKSGKEQYTMIDDFDPNTYFKHSFGISTTDKAPEDVVLSFTQLEGKYVKNRTIHHTQKTVTDTAKELRISIKVMISYELIMQILGYGDQVKVIKPASLAKTIKEMHQKAADRY